MVLGSDRCAGFLLFRRDYLLGLCLVPSPIVSWESVVQPFVWLNEVACFVAVYFVRKGFNDVVLYARRGVVDVRGQTTLIFEKNKKTRCEKDI